MGCCFSKTDDFDYAPRRRDRDTAEDRMIRAGLAKAQRNARAETISRTAIAGDRTQYGDPRTYKWPNLRPMTINRAGTHSTYDWPPDREVYGNDAIVFYPVRGEHVAMHIDEAEARYVLELRIIGFDFDRNNSTAQKLQKKGDRMLKRMLEEENNLQIYPERVPWMEAKCGPQRYDPQYPWNGPAYHPHEGVSRNQVERMPYLYYEEPLPSLYDGDSERPYDTRKLKRPMSDSEKEMGTLYLGMGKLYRKEKPGKTLMKRGRRTD